MSLNLNYQPEVLVSTEGLTEEEWLNYRRKGIGGSDAAAIMGQSPFCTKRDLYYDKLGIKSVLEEEESNWVAKEVGHRLEDLVAQIFSAKTGLTVFPIRKMFRHPLYPFMVADVDFFIEFPDGTFGILECKTTNYHCQDKWANNSVPVNYEYQGRHYMSVVNLNVVYFACLYGNNEDEFIIRRMDRDLDSEADLIAEEENFWMENILKRTEPPYIEKPDLVLESIRKFCGPAEPDNDAIKLGSSYLSFVERYLELKDKKSEIDAEAKRLETVYGDNVFEKDGIRRDRTGDGEKTRCLCGKRGIFNRDGPAMGPQIIRQLERRASRRSASFFSCPGEPWEAQERRRRVGRISTRRGAKNLDTRPFSGARRAARPVPEVTAADKEDGLRGP